MLCSGRPGVANPPGVGRRVGRDALFATFVIALLVLAVARPAMAHVDLASSDPADGSVVDGPVDAVELTFTEAAEPAGEGVVIVTGGDDPVPAAVAQVDDTTLRITPDEPLGEGAFAVGWTVRAGDAHPRSGAVTFTVARPTESGTQPEGSQPRAPSGATDETETTQSPEIPSSIERLIDGPDTTGADWLGRFARILGLAGSLTAVGALIFSAGVPLRSARDAAYVGYWIRRSGLAVVVSVPLEIVAQSGALNGGSLAAGVGLSALSSTLGGPLGWAMLFRAAGGLGMLRGTHIATRSASMSEHAPRERHQVHSGGTLLAQRSGHRLDLSRSPLAIAGGVVLVISYFFDGHTATASPVWLVRFADAIHVSAGAAWVGGVVLLAAILRRRHRAGLPPHAGELVIRFSVIAAAALAAVAIAGIALAWSILDSVGELFGTPWGRGLLAKLSGVGVAAAIGAYNHYFVVPSIIDGDEASSDLIRRTARWESRALLGVVALTAVLVGLSS